MRAHLAIPLLLFACNACGARQLSPEEQQQITALRSELQTVQAERTAAEAQDSQLSGGLIKMLTQARLEVLRTNEALISQRIHAVEAGARITSTVLATAPDVELANTLQGEIEVQAAAVERAQRDAEGYSGGLLHALKLTTVATEQQSLALLRQRFLVAKYGLALPKPVDPGPETAAPRRAATPAPAPADQSAPLPLGNGPFGLRIGLSTEDLRSQLGSDFEAVEGRPGLYRTSTVPTPHREFESYAFQVTPMTGLCWVKAIGVDIPTSRHGVELRSRFDDMYRALEATYGAGQRKSQLLPGSIWDEPEDFMMALLKKERWLYAEWAARANQPFKGEVSSLVLAGQAADTERGFLVLEYQFANYDACQQEADAQERGAL